MDTGAFDESLLILSDVHLGNDLNDLTPDASRRSARVDADLADLLAHYRRTPPKKSPLAARHRRRLHRLHRDGDPSARRAPRYADSSAEEREHGLGNSADHGRLKLRAVAARHPAVLQALADFVADGHALTIVHGNHDVEFHWDVGQAGLPRDLLACIAQRHRRARDHERAAATTSRSASSSSPGYST